MIQQLKDDLNELSELYSDILGTDVSRTLRDELKRFTAYILTADGRISDEEPLFIGELFGIEFTETRLANYAAAESLNSTEFSSRVPPLFRRCIKNIGASCRYIALFYNVGREALVCDYNASDSEVEAYNSYLTMLCDFYNTSNPDSGVKASFTYDEYSDQSHEDKGNLIPPPPPVPETPAPPAESPSKAPVKPPKTPPTPVSPPIKVVVRLASDETPAPAPAKEDDETLEDLLRELDGLIGLASVKKNVYSLLHLQSVQSERERRGLPKIAMSNHLVFTGNPGTGKTTVARLIARIYYKIGLLSTGNFVEVDRSGMVAGYVGQTAINVKNVMDSAKGGVLFIDEAYSLATGGRGDFGLEAIETLLKRMEDDREDMIVIVAGYPELMERFISSNPGLRSRFSKKIYFPDYDPDELLKIFESMVKKHAFTISDEALAYAREVLEYKYLNRGEDFANAREVRNFFEAAVVKQADRLFGRLDLSDEELCRIEAEDLEHNELML